jgi:hypothetical protein
MAHISVIASLVTSLAERPSSVKTTPIKQSFSLREAQGE